MGENETDKLEDTQDKAVEDQSNGSKNNDDADTGSDEDTSTDDKNSKGEDDKDSSDTEKDNDDDKKSQKSTSNANDDEPTVRKRSDFIKERIERRQQKNAEKSESSDKDNEDDIDLDDTDKKTIGKVVENYLKPLVEKEIKAQDEQEISEFLKNNPDFKPYEAKARKFMDHPSRKDVPIDEIFYGVAGKDLLKIGAKRAKIANDEAKATATGGSQDLGGSKSVSEMSKAEFEAKQIEIRQKLADRD